MWFPWSDSIKTRLCRFLLHHYIGHFLEEKLSLEQMSVELYAGKGTINNVALNTETLNESLEQLNLPFEITEGFIGRVSIGVPWSALVSSSTTVEIDGLEITIQPKSYSSTAYTSMIDSFRNMTTSLVLAQQVMEEEVGETKLEGLEAFATMIESVLSRVKCSFTNTALRLQSKDPNVNVSLELIIDRIEYFDERESKKDVPENDVYIPTSIAHKVILLSGISLRLSGCYGPQNHLFQSYINTNDSVTPEPITIAKFLGEQQVKIHFKVNDQLPGPKLDLECSAGSIHCMVSPSQVHKIFDLVQSIATTLSERRKEIGNMRCKKMSNEDFMKVEQELHLDIQRNKQRRQTDMPSLEQSECFYSMTAGGNGDMSLPPLDIPSNLQSIPLSTADVGIQRFSGQDTHKEQEKKRVGETPEDKINVQLNLRYVVVTVLHQNLTSVSVSSRHTSNPMAALSTRYFSDITPKVKNNYEMDSVIITETLNKVCRHDHLLCIGVNTNFRMELITSTQQIDTNLVLSVTKLEVEEYLYSSHVESCKTPSVSPVLLLKHTEPENFTESIYHTTSPAFSVTFKSFTANDEYKTSLQLDLGDISFIADVTMFDRVGMFHKPKSNVHHPVLQELASNTASMVRQDIFDQVMGTDILCQDSMKEFYSFNSTCGNLAVTLRFPIPDMRPIEQRSWWVPSLRADYVVLHIQDITVEHQKENDTSELFVDFSKLNCDYLMNSDAEPISFLMAGCIPGQMEPRPSVKIRISPGRISPLLDYNSPTVPLVSLDNILNLSDSQPSPFATKKVMYEGEELVMPGSTKEMDDFEEETSAKCRFAVSFSVPELLIYFQDKAFFETLYNRLLTDLMLWTPGAPVAQDSNHPVEPEIFRMCTSTAHRESDSDESESENDFLKPMHNQDSWISVSVDIAQGRLSLNTSIPPGPDQSPLHQNPVGEILLELINTHLYTIVEYQGDPDTSFFSMYAESGTLYHGNNYDMNKSTASTTTDAQIDSLNEILTVLSDYLAEDLPPPKPDYSMLHMATKMYFDQAKNIKEITLAVSLQNTCHRYYVMPLNENYMLQIAEFFNVQDYDVAGYKLPLSVTALHTHLWNFAVDYRPIYLPWKALVTVQSLGISSNLALDSITTSLRILLEDLSLYLAPAASSGILNQDYVKLVEIDLFELIVKIMLERHEKIPQLDIDTKTNLLQIKSCADGTAALRDLILYCVSEGDLYPPTEDPVTSPPKTTRVREHSSSDDVPSLVKSAVNTEDLKRLDLTLDKSEVPATKVGYSAQTFTFPDDAVPLQQTTSDIAHAAEDESEDVPLVMNTAYKNSITTAVMSAIDDEDDEFCVVESEIVETMVAKGQFVVKKITDKTPQFIDHYFVLPDDTDQLKAPAHYPTPMSRVTVKEISLIWNIYGGCDFPCPAPPCKTNTSPSTPRSDRYSTCESPTKDVDSSKAEGRNKDQQMEFFVSKMKLRLEQYPETASENFRLCLILNDIEIKDKMGSSNFNKFLYQYSTENNPRPTRTPMGCIKVLHKKSDENIEDATIRVSVLPLRFNIDQDALLFLFSYFNSVSDKPPYRRPRVSSTGSTNIAVPPVNIGNLTYSQQQLSSPLPPPQQRQPFSEPRSFSEPLSFGKSSAYVEKSFVRAMPERYSTSAGTHHPSVSSPATVSSSLPKASPASPDNMEKNPVFVKAFVFSPDVPIRVDYKGKTIRGDKNLISNPITNLLIGLAQLNCSELRLKSLCYRQGLLGYPKLLEWVILQWVNDIKTTQLPSILGGVGPMHSFIQLCSGVIDLVYLPVQQYKEDGRIMKGLQRGTNSFTYTTAVSLLQLTSKLFSSIQSVAEVTCDLVSPSQPRKASPSHHQPTDLREGFVNAYEVMSTDISARASKIQHAAVYNHSTKGITSAIGGVLREIPPTLLLPFITLPKAITLLTFGAQNHLKPSTIKEREEKYRQIQ